MNFAVAFLLLAGGYLMGLGVAYDACRRSLWSPPAALPPFLVVLGLLSALAASLLLA